MASPTALAPVPDVDDPATRRKFALDRVAEQIRWHRVRACPAA
jgi:hypothetical protein